MRAAGLHDVWSRGSKCEVALDGEAANSVPQLRTHQRERELLAIINLRQQHVSAKGDRLPRFARKRCLGRRLQRVFQHMCAAAAPPSGPNSPLEQCIISACHWRMLCEWEGLLLRPHLPSATHADRHE